jgi:hypothetical protein
VRVVHRARGAGVAAALEVVELAVRLADDVPPACRTRAATVASISGTYPSRLDAPFVIGTPASKILVPEALDIPMPNPS